MKNFKYHFEAEKGWINDPNGLSFYNGKIHMFYQYNPYDIQWDTMHWGHAVTEDFLKYENLPIALYPDMEYEKGLGCFSGSAVEKDGILHFFYTAVDKNKNQLTCHATMDKDGRIFKDERNPLIHAESFMNQKEFRDPKVTFMDGIYYMVIGTEIEGTASVVLYTSKDLKNFSYTGVLYQNKEYGNIMECPDFFKLGDTYILSVSLIGRNPGTRMLTGRFRNNKFLLEQEYRIEEGMHYYASQSFLYKERRIQFGWLRDIYVKNSESAGCMSVPREIFFEDGVVKSYPVEEMKSFITHKDKDIKILGNKAYYKNEIFYEGKIKDISMIRDNSILEVYMNHGEKNFIFFES